MDDKGALVVIDMQNDYLWESRKKKFGYDSAKLVGNVNSAIADYSARGYDIIYIKQIFPDIITNRWIIGFSIKGTDGAKIYDKIDIVSDLIFDKNLPDTYTSKAFREHMEREGYREVVLCGLDECGCVGATAKGALKTGVRVKMLTDGIGCRFPDPKRIRMREDLMRLGAEYI